MKGSVLGRRFEYTAPRPAGISYRDTSWKEYVLRHHEMANWCSEQKFDHWGTQGCTFWFYNEQDYLMFIMRWAQ